MKRTYEEDAQAFPAEYYSVKQYPGVAFYVLGWETQQEAVTCLVEEEDENGDTFSYEMLGDDFEDVRTGRVLAVMVGDDYRHCVELEDLTPLEREAFCGECGQIGCSHDGLDREEA
jgi:hypothetical protein